MCEIFVFYTLIELMQEEEEGESESMRNEFFYLIKNENVLPKDFCQDLLFQKGMVDEALIMLFQRREHRPLLSTIRKKYSEARDPE